LVNTPSAKAARRRDGFIHSEVFEHEYYNAQIMPPATILDLGANIGLATVYFHRLFPAADLACVERFPQNLSILHENLALNNVRASVFHGAIDSNDGHIMMEISSKNYGHRTVAPGEVPSGQRFA